MKFQTDGRREETTSTRTRRFPDTGGSELEESLTVHYFSQKEGFLKCRFSKLYAKGKSVEIEESSRLGELGRDLGFLLKYAKSAVGKSAIKCTTGIGACCLSNV